MREIQIGERRILVTNLTAIYVDICELCIAEVNQAILAHRKEEVDIYKTIIEIEKAQKRFIDRRKKITDGL